MIHQIAHVILQRHKAFIECQDVGELAYFHVTQIGRAFAGLQGNLQLVMHFVIAEGYAFQINLLVGILLVPHIGQQIVIRVMLADERPQGQFRWGCFRRCKAHNTQQHAQRESEG